MASRVSDRSLCPRASVKVGRSASAATIALPPDLLAECPRRSASRMPLLAGAEPTTSVSRRLALSGGGFSPLWAINFGQDNIERRDVVEPRQLQQMSSKRLGRAALPVVDSCDRYPKLLRDLELGQ